MAEAMCISARALSFQTPGDVVAGSGSGSAVRNEDAAASLDAAASSSALASVSAASQPPQVLTHVQSIILDSSVTGAIPSISSATSGVPGLTASMSMMTMRTGGLMSPMPPTTPGRPGSADGSAPGGSSSLAGASTAFVLPSSSTSPRDQASAGLSSPSSATRQASIGGAACAAGLQTGQAETSYVVGLLATHIAHVMANTPHQSPKHFTALVQLVAVLPLLRQSGARAKFVSRLLGIDQASATQLLEDISRVPLPVLCAMRTPAQEQRAAHEVERMVAAAQQAADEAEAAAARLDEVDGDDDDGAEGADFDDVDGEYTDASGTDYDGDDRSNDDRSGTDNERSDSGMDTDGSGAGSIGGRQRRKHTFRPRRGPLRDSDDDAGSRGGERRVRSGRNGTSSNKPRNGRSRRKRSQKRRGGIHSGSRSSSSGSGSGSSASGTGSGRRLPDDKPTQLASLLQSLLSPSSAPCSSPHNASFRSSTSARSRHKHSHHHPFNRRLTTSAMATVHADVDDVGDAAATCSVGGVPSAYAAICRHGIPASMAATVSADAKAAASSILAAGALNSLSGGGGTGQRDAPGDDADPFADVVDGSVVVSGGACGDDANDAATCGIDGGGGAAPTSSLSPAAVVAESPLLQRSHSAGSNNSAGSGGSRGSHGFLKRQATPMPSAFDHEIHAQMGGGGSRSGGVDLGMGTSIGSITGGEVTGSNRVTTTTASQPQQLKVDPSSSTDGGTGEIVSPRSSSASHKSGGASTASAAALSTGATSGSGSRHRRLLQRQTSNARLPAQALPTDIFSGPVMTIRQRALLTLGRWASGGHWETGDALQQLALDLFLSALQFVSPVFLHSEIVVHVLQTLCTSAPTSIVRVYYARALRTLFGRGAPTSAAVVYRQVPINSQSPHVPAPAAASAPGVIAAASSSSAPATIRQRVPNLARSVVLAVHDIIHAHLGDMAHVTSRTRHGELPPMSPASAARSGGHPSVTMATTSTPSTPALRHRGASPSAVAAREAYMAGRANSLSAGAAAAAVGSCSSASDETRAQLLPISTPTSVSAATGYGGRGVDGDGMTDDASPFMRRNNSLTAIASSLPQNTMKTVHLPGPASVGGGGTGRPGMMIAAPGGAGGYRLPSSGGGTPTSPPRLQPSGQPGAASNGGAGLPHLSSPSALGAHPNGSSSGISHRQYGSAPAPPSPPAHPSFVPGAALNQLSSSAALSATLPAWEARRLDTSRVDVDFDLQVLMSFIGDLLHESKSHAAQRAKEKAASKAAAAAEGSKIRISGSSTGTKQSTGASASSTSSSRSSSSSSSRRGTVSASSTSMTAQSGSEDASGASAARAATAGARRKLSWEAGSDGQQSDGGSGGSTPTRSSPSPSSSRKQQPPGEGGLKGSMMMSIEGTGLTELGLASSLRGDVGSCGLSCAECGGECSVRISTLTDAAAPGSESPHDHDHDHCEHPHQHGGPNCGSGTGGGSSSSGTPVDQLVSSQPSAGTTGRAWELRSPHSSHPYGQLADTAHVNSGTVGGQQQAAGSDGDLSAPAPASPPPEQLTSASLSKTGRAGTPHVGMSPSSSATGLTGTRAHGSDDSTSGGAGGGDKESLSPRSLDAATLAAKLQAAADADGQPGSWSLLPRVPKLPLVGSDGSSTAVAGTGVGGEEAQQRSVTPRPAQVQQQQQQQQRASTDEPAPNKASPSSTAAPPMASLSKFCPSSDRGGAGLALWMEVGRAVATAAVKLSSVPDGGDGVTPEYKSVLTCALQLCNACPLLREIVLRRVLRKWPLGNSDNEIALLEFLATVLATATHRADLVVTDLRGLLLSRLCRALSSNHIKVARNALVLADPTRRLIDFLVDDPNALKRLLSALDANASKHWSPMVRRASAAAYGVYYRQAEAMSARTGMPLTSFTPTVPGAVASAATAASASLALQPAVSKGGLSVAPATGTGSPLLAKQQQLQPPPVPAPVSVPLPPAIAASAAASSSSTDFSSPLHAGPGSTRSAAASTSKEAGSNTASSSTASATSAVTPLGAPALGLAYSDGSLTVSHSVQMVRGNLNASSISNVDVDKAIAASNVGASGAQPMAVVKPPPAALDVTDRSPSAAVVPDPAAAAAPPPQTQSAPVAGPPVPRRRSSFTGSIAPATAGGAASAAAAAAAATTAALSKKQSPLATSAPSGSSANSHAAGSAASGPSPQVVPLRAVRSPLAIATPAGGASAASSDVPSGSYSPTVARLMAAAAANMNLPLSGLSPGQQQQQLSAGGNMSPLSGSMALPGPALVGTAPGMAGHVVTLVNGSSLLMQQQQAQLRSASPGGRSSKLATSSSSAAAAGKVGVSGRSGSPSTKTHQQQHPHHAAPHWGVGVDVVEGEF